MKGTVGTVVVTGCVLGVVGWVMLERYRYGRRGERAVEGGEAGAVRSRGCLVPRHAVGPGAFRRVRGRGGVAAPERRGSDGGVRGRGIGPGVGRRSGLRGSARPRLVLGLVGFVQRRRRGRRPADWSAADGFLGSPDAHPFVAAVLAPVPLSGELVMGALDADPRLVFNVVGSEFEAFATFDSARVRAVVGALAGACGGGPAPRG